MPMSSIEGKSQNCDKPESPLLQSNFLSFECGMADMPYRWSVIWALLWMSCVMVAEGRVGNCTQVTEPLLLSPLSGGSVLYTYGTTNIIYSAIDGINQPDSFFLNFSFLGLAERAKQAVTGKCETPTGLGTNPFTPTVDDQLASTILNYYSFEEADCHAYKDTKVINNTHIRGNYVRYTRSDFPGFSILLSLEYADSDVSVFVSDNTTFTNGTLYGYSWPADTLKVTSTIEGFPWSMPAPSDNKSTEYVSIHFQLGVDLRADSDATYGDSSSLTFLTHNTSNQRLHIEFEKLYLIDGVPFGGTRNRYYEPVTISAQNNILLEAHVGLGFCSNFFGHWNTSIYDPQITSLFLNPPATPETDTQSPETKRNNKIVVSIVVPIVCVVTLGAILTAGIVILKSPSLKAKVLPFRARNEAASAPSMPNKHQGNPQSSSNPERATSGWTPSQKPGN